MGITLTNGSFSYQVGDLVKNTDLFRVYICYQVETKRQCLLQITTAVEHNGALDRAAYMLKQLAIRAAEVEKAYAKVKSDPKALLNYQLGFPEVLDSFICQEQGGRRVTILAFGCAEKVSQLVPLTNITDKDRQRIDTRTSVWPMGKTLKLLSFLHNEGVSVNNMSGDNILIVPETHCVLIFDFSALQAYDSGFIPADRRRNDIAQAAKAVIVAMGGNPTKGNFPDSDESTAKYEDILLRLAKGNFSNAQNAHTTFYEIVDAIWPKEYYPFTTKPL